MVSIQQTSNFNVETTLNAALATAVAAFTRPSWLPSVPTVVFVPGDIALAAPCYGVIHIPVASEDLYQGRRGDAANVTRDTALMDVSAWVSSEASASWQAQLRTMVDMVKHWHNRSPQIVIQNYATDATAPVATTYKVNLNGITVNPIQQDADNPALWRARMLIDYSWSYRA